MEHTLQALERCHIQIEDNIRVLDSLDDFYEKLPNLLEASNLSPNNLSSTTEGKDGLKALHATLKRAIQHNQGALARVGVLEKLTSSRAEFIQKMIENRTN